MGYWSEVDPIPVINPPRPPKDRKDPKAPPYDPSKPPEWPPEPGPDDPYPPRDEPPQPAKPPADGPFPDSPPEEEPPEYPEDPEEPEEPEEPEDDGDDDDDDGDDDGDDDDDDDDDDGRVEDALQRMEEAAARAEEARAAAEDARRAAQVAADQARVGNAAVARAREAADRASDSAATLAQLPASSLAGPAAQGLWRIGVGEPVDPLTGAWLYEHTDAVVNTARPELAVRRAYCSRLFRRGLFGLGWDTWMDTAVRLLANGTAYVSTGDRAGGFFGPPPAPGQPFQAPEELDGVRLTRRGNGWLLVGVDGWRRELDVAGRVVRVAHPDGTGIQLVRNAAGLPVAMRHDDGARLTLVTDATGLVREVRDDIGRAWLYTYDGVGRLTSVTDPTERSWRYTYGTSSDPRERAAITQMLNPAGSTAVSNTYDSAPAGRGRVVEQTVFGDRWRFVYTRIAPTPDATVANRHTVALRVAVEDPTGTVTGHAFGATGRLLSTSIPSQAGQSVTRWSWTVNGHIAEIQRPRGDRVSLTWARFGPTWRCKRIAQRSGALTIPTSFEFDGEGRLLSSVDAAGARTDFERDAAGRVVRVLGPVAPVAGGAPQRAVTNYAYDARGREIRRQDPEGTVLEQSYVAAGPGVGLVADITQDGSVVARFAYDGVGRLTTVRGFGTTQAAQEWNEADQLTAEVDPTGARREFSYDARGAVTQIRQQLLDETGTPQSPAWTETAVTCDHKGRIVRTQTATPTGTATSTLTYDGLDRVVETVSPAGLRTSNEYDGAGRVTRRRVGVGTSTEAVHRWEHEIGGEAVLFIDPSGGRWVSTVDGFGRPATVSRPDGVVDVLGLDSLGRAIALRTMNSAGTLLAQERLVFDATGRITKTGARVVRPGRAPGAWADINLSYDAARRLLRSTDPTGAVTSFTWSVAGLTQITDAGGSTVGFDHDTRGMTAAVRSSTSGGLVVRRTYEHDDLGRVTAEQDVLGNRSTFAYDGLSRLVVTTDPAGTSTRLGHDPVGAVAQIDVTSPAGAAVTTTFQNDLSGCVTAVIDPDGARWTMSRDTFGRILFLVGPGSATSTALRYDAAGRTISTTSAAGWTTTFERDALGRITKATSTHGTDRVVEVWEFDALGRATRAQGPDHEVRAEWDSLGRCWRESLDGAWVDLDWAPVGALRSITLPDATRITYLRDAVGQVTRVTTARPGQPALRTDTTWLRPGQPAEVASRVGTEVTRTKYTYDRAGRLVQVSVTGPQGGIEQVTTLLDARGLPAVVHRAGHKVVAPTIGPAAQLIALRSGSAGQTPDLSSWMAGGTADQAALDALASTLRPAGAPVWQVDLTPGGDRTRVQTAGVTTTWQPDHAHRYTQVAGEVPSYDAAGRLIEWDGRRFEYDHLDRLVRVTDLAGAAIVERSFDTWGRPVSWTTSAGMRTAVLVGMDVLGEGPTGGGSSWRYAPGLGLDQPAAVHDGTAWRLLHRDQIWSVLAVSATGGQVLRRADWGPAGELTTLDALFAPATGSVEHLRFQGRPRLTDNLLDVRHRVLLVPWGRFTAPDPIGPAGGLNPYVFAGNNPMVFLDPTGELAFLAPMLAGALVGGVFAAVTNWDKNGADFAAAVAAGAAGGAVAAIPGLGAMGFALGGALTGAANGGYQGYKQGGVVGALTNGSVNAVIGGVSGLAGGVIGARVATSATAMLTSTLTAGAAKSIGAGLGDTGSRLVAQYAGAGVGGAAGGFTGGFTGGTMQSVFSSDFASADGLAAAQVALTHGFQQGTDGAMWGAVGGVSTKALMHAGWLLTPNPEGGGGLTKVLGFEGEFQAQGWVGALKATFTTPGGKRPDVWGSRRWWSTERIYGDAKNTNKVPTLNENNGQLRDMLNTVPNLFDPANKAAGGNTFTIFHSPGIKLPGARSEIGGLARSGVIDLIPLRQFVYGLASTNDQIC